MKLRGLLPPLSWSPSLPEGGKGLCRLHCFCLGTCPLL